MIWPFLTYFTHISLDLYGHLYQLAHGKLVACRKVNNVKSGVRKIHVFLRPWLNKGQYIDRVSRKFFMLETFFKFFFTLFSFIFLFALF